MKFEQAFEQLNSAQSGCLTSQSAKISIFKHTSINNLARVPLVGGGAISVFEQPTQEELDSDDWVVALPVNQAIQDIDFWTPVDNKRPGTVMTGNNFPKEIIRALGLPRYVQEFTLRVKRDSIAEVECRYYPVIQSPGEQDVKGTD